MSNVTRPPRQFRQVLLALLRCWRGRANFRNFSRYSHYHEKTFSRWYRRGFDWVEFNRLSLLPWSESETTLIAAAFLGLNHGQARCRPARHFHFKASMSVLKMIKLEDRQPPAANTVGSGKVISMASWKIRQAHVHLLERFFSYLGLDLSRIKSRPDLEPLCNYGTIAMSNCANYCQIKIKYVPMIDTTIVNKVAR